MPPAKANHMMLHYNISWFGKKTGSKSVEEKLDNLARQNASVGSLVIMSVAVSGDKSLGSSLARILSLRGL